jgi:hypothetical protein
MFQTKVLKMKDAFYVHCTCSVSDMVFELCYLKS